MERAVVKDSSLLTRERLARIMNERNPLGEADMLSEIRTKTTLSFLGKEKK